MLQLIQAGGSLVGKPSRIAAPEQYSGRRVGLKPFLTNIDWYCRFNQFTYNDHDKILMTLMHMKDKAAEWIQSLVSDYLKNDSFARCKDETQGVFKTWDAVVEELNTIFEGVNEVAAAERKIEQHKQSKSASSYARDFKQLRSMIHWDDAPLIATFYNGLKERFKDEIVQVDRPDKIDDMIKMAVRNDEISIIEIPVIRPVSLLKQSKALLRTLKRL